MFNRYRELIPNADVTEMSTLGHYLQIEYAEAICAV